MKNRILTFIIGILVGSIITTTGFLIYSKTTNKNVNPNERMHMNQDGQIQMPNGNMGERPEKTQGDFRTTIPNNEV